MKIENVRVGGIDPQDHPKYCDAYIESATIDGREATEKELEELTEDYDFLYEAIINQIHERMRYN